MRPKKPTANPSRGDEKSSLAGQPKAVNREKSGRKTLPNNKKQFQNIGVTYKLINARYEFNQNRHFSCRLCGEPTTPRGGFRDALLCWRTANVRGILYLGRFR